MIQLINNFSTTISENNGSVKVNYVNGPLSGYCEYKLIHVNNRLSQKAWLLINSDMGDIIEYIHSNSPLKEEDMSLVSKMIKDHSLSKVTSIVPR